jgi:hypothetical protein
MAIDKMSGPPIARPIAAVSRNEPPPNQNPARQARFDEETSLHPAGIEVAKLRRQRQESGTEPEPNDPCRSRAIFT